MPFRPCLKPAIIALAMLTLAAPSQAETVTTHRLDNGMEVVVIEDHRAPVVVNMVWYRAGAADEPPGKSGIAHFLEHLMFKGTDDLAPGAFSEIVAANGGSDNAFTSRDATAYFQRIAADRLELVIRMEADRMRDLRLSEADFLTERAVVLEERAQRTDSDPGALFSEQRAAALYLNHPYGVPVIGWRHEIEALTLKDALEFYRRYYAPNNAVLIVAGDVDPAEVLRLARKHFGPLAPTPDLPVRTRPQEPPQLSGRRLVMEDARVGQPYVVRSYLAPERDSGNQQQAAALEILAEILGGSPMTSVLAGKLQFGQKIALHSAAFYDGAAYDDTSFGIFVIPEQGVSLAGAEAALDQAIAEFLEEGIDPEQLDRVKRQARAARIYADDSASGLARRYGRALTAGLTPEDIRAWPDILQAVTGEDVMTAARALFDRRRAVTGWLTRPESGEETQ